MVNSPLYMSKVNDDAKARIDDCLRCKHLVKCMNMYDECGGDRPYKDMTVRCQGFEARVKK